MSETVAAYWGPRTESPESAAERLVPLLQVLAAGGRWYRTGSAAPGPDDEVEPTAAALGDLLSKGRNRRDMDRSVITELGYSLSLWDGRGDDGTSLTAQVGATSTTPGTGNNVVIKVPDSSAVHTRAEEVFAALVAATDPDRAIWMTRDYRRTQQTVGGLPYVGWQSYLTDRYAARVGSPPAGVTTRPLGRGLWVTAGETTDDRSRTLAAEVASRL